MYFLVYLEGEELHIFEEEKSVTMKLKDVFLKLFLGNVKFLGKRHLSLSKIGRKRSVFV